MVPAVPAFAWVLLLLAGLLEIVWAIALKQSDGFTRMWPTVITAVGAAASFFLLSLAMRAIPVGTAYAIWVGIGAIGIAIFGIAFYGETLSAPRILAFGLVLTGIILLKLTSPG